MQNVVEFAVATTPREEATLEPVQFVDPSTVTDGIPAERGAVQFTSADDKILIGTWAAEPFAGRVDNAPATEYASLLRGVVRLTSDDGEVREFRAGDSFVTPAGWSGEYRVVESVLKQFVIVQS